MQYLVEIKDHPSFIEHIDEKFDGISNLMTPNAVIYGSSLTSLISRIYADGDLDISISPQEYNTLAQRVQASEKWLQVEGEEVKVNRHWRFGSHLFKASKSSNYKDIPDFPMDEAVAFQTTNGAKVQLIKAKSNSYDPLNDALEVVRKVDFVFCGVAMDCYGRIIEAIPHAYSDCLAGAIRVANYRPGENPDRVKARLEKYIKRGWQLSISYDTIFANLRKASEEAKKKGKPAEKATSIKFQECMREGRACLMMDNYNRTGLTASDIMEITTALHKANIDTRVVEETNVETKNTMLFLLPGGVSGKTFHYFTQIAKQNLKMILAAKNGATEEPCYWSNTSASLGTYSTI